MNEQKGAHQTDTLQCQICHKNFNSQEELQKHNREFHPQGQTKEQGSMRDQRHQGQAGGSGQNPNFDKGQERKGPGSEQKESEHEQRQPSQKRAAS